MSIKKARQRIVRKKVKEVTFGITDGLMNVVLYSMYLSGSIIGKSGPAGVHRGFNEADELISEFGARRVRNSLNNLRQSGYIKGIGGKLRDQKITRAGLDRINNLFSVYDTERIWDGKVYIINYDIPRIKNRHRDILRDYLKKLNTAKLQDSVYLTPYNPRDVVEIIVDEYKIEGQILISTLNPEYAFGGGDIRNMLWDIYNLDLANSQYSNFIEKYKNTSTDAAGRLGIKLSFSFLAALDLDPQIPFKLLLDKYLGDEAYLLYERLLGYRRS